MSTVVCTLFENYKGSACSCQTGSSKCLGHSVMIVLYEFVILNTTVVKSTFRLYNILSCMETGNCIPGCLCVSLRSFTVK